MLTALVNIIKAAFSAFFVPRRPSPVPPQAQRKSFSAEVLRADDLLVLRLDFYNLRLQPGPTGKKMVSDGPGQSFIVVHFPPQHIAEQAFLEGDPNDPLLPQPIAARLAGESRLVFYLAPSSLPLDFSLEAILEAFSRSTPLVVDRITIPPPTPAVGGTAQFGGIRTQFSAIEAPWRLILSPHPDGRWAHSAKSVTDGDNTELWHTRLGVSSNTIGVIVDETSKTTRTARVVYSQDYRGSFPPAPEGDLTPFRNSLRRYHRDQIVRLTADRKLEGNAPVAVERLMLSSLGAGLQLHGEWNTLLDLIEWRHRATLGRDQFVKVVLKGFLFPLGHRAVKITITERKLAMGVRNELEGKPVAYLRQRTFIVVREPIKSYSHRAFPFRKVEFKRLTSPDLLEPTPADKIPLSSGGADTFWPRYQDGGPKDVLFQLEGTDWDTKKTSFSAPLIFVPASADLGPDIDDLVQAYNGAAGMFAPVPEAPRRTVPTGGQKIAFAPSMKSGDTTLETDELILAALNATGTPHFLPAMRGARVNNTSLRQISKGSGPHSNSF